MDAIMGSHTFNLYCAQCGDRVVRYRKEGSGSLVRLYLDRIIEPKPLPGVWQAARKSGLQPLDCQRCGQPIGFPMPRGAGNRPAFRLIKGSTRKGQ